MINNIINNCWSSSKVTSSLEGNSICPNCNQSGIKVKKITVKNLVIKEIVNKITEDYYYLCKNKKYFHRYFFLYLYFVK